MKIRKLRMQKVLLHWAQTKQTFHCLAYFAAAVSYLRKMFMKLTPDLIFRFPNFFPAQVPFPAPAQTLTPAPTLAPTRPRPPSPSLPRFWATSGTVVIKLFMAVIY